MATYTPESLNIKAPAGGFQTGGWYSGRQYWNGTLSDPGVIHPASNQQGAGQAVSAEVNAQSAAQQGVSPQQFESYLQQQRQQQPSTARPVQQPTQQPQGAGFSEAGQSTGGGALNIQPAIDLPGLYKQLQESSGIKELENEYLQKEREFIEAKGKINDNPFLSEATRVGREAKIQKLFDERTANLRKDIETKKADIETQLNLQLKQLDIESNAAQLALSQFNTLLQTGALNNASPEDISAIASRTGMSVGMIQSAVSQSAMGDLSIQAYDDGINQYYVTVDQRGNIVNRQLVGPSKKTGTGDGGFDSSAFLAALYQDQTSPSIVQVESIINDVVAPAMSPQNGIGSQYIDELGRLWIYDRSGWVLMS